MDGRNCKRRIDLQKIILSESIKKILTQHAENEYPNESCAILYGNIKNENYIVKETWLTKNIEKSPVEFTLSPEQTLKMYEKEKEMGLQIIGIFHSHPNSQAIPSSPVNILGKIISPDKAILHDADGTSATFSLQS